EAALAPARRGGLDDRELGVALEPSTERGRADASSFALRIEETNHLLEEVGTFEPPVAKELGVERGHDDRLVADARVERIEVCLARGDELRGVLACTRRSDPRVVLVLVRSLAGDAVELEAGHHASAARTDFPLELFARQVEAEVAVELAVDGIAGIPGLARP